jgi:hypothetical protein
MGWRVLVAISAGLLFIAGCSNSPYESGYSYFPQPATVDVRRVGSNQPSPLTVLVTVLGVRQGDPKHDIPYSVAVRMRFENIGQSRITFDPHTLELVTGTLRPFPPPILEPPQPFELASRPAPRSRCLFSLPAGHQSIANESSEPSSEMGSQD